MQGGASHACAASSAGLQPGGRETDARSPEPWLRALCPKALLSPSARLRPCDPECPPGSRGVWGLSVFAARPRPRAAAAATPAGARGRPRSPSGEAACAFQGLVLLPCVFVLSVVAVPFSKPPVKWCARCRTHPSSIEIKSIAVGTARHSSRSPPPHTVWYCRRHPSPVSAQQPLIGFPCRDDAAIICGLQPT